MTSAYGRFYGGDEYYDVVIFYYGGPLWSLEPSPPTAVTFRCVGHTTPKSMYWQLVSVSPDQPLPACSRSKGSYMGGLLNMLAMELTQLIGKPVSGLYRTVIETPIEGPGAFWRHVADLSAVANYYSATKITPIQQRVNGAASYVQERRR